jgi:hypothetical protein
MESIKSTGVKYTAYRGTYFCKQRNAWVALPADYQIVISCSEYPDILNTLPKNLKYSTTVEGDQLTLTAYTLTTIKKLENFINNYEIPTYQ